MAFEFGAAAAAATAGGVGMGLFSYNRANYMTDQKSHYGRFTAGLNMAIAQTGLYKQDIAQLTELTATRQDCYHGIAAMGLTILTAIYCPGRLGLHTPPPPGWLMGLAFVNIAGCYMFLGLTVWLAMHASMRSSAASTHMLTRFVRLPIPSQGMLDKARKFGSSYEEQPLKEVFRVPFTSHQRKSRAGDGGYNEDLDMDPTAKKRSRHGYDVPAWYKKEKAVDNVNTIDTMESMMPLGGQGTAPEHFEAYREIQNEWFPYDVYARLSLFLAFMHLTSCWSFMQIGHQLQENRALWACFIVQMPMFVLQQIVLTLDIVPDAFPIHRLGPFALWFAYMAAVIEYKRWFTADVQALGFFFVYIAYIIEIIYTLQLLRICAPAKDAPAVAESPHAAWWPGEWRLPSAFQHAIWLVAPPKKLQEGENDIVAELRAAQTGAAGQPSGASSEKRKRADVHCALGEQGESPAWFNVRAGLVSLVIAWLFLTLGFTVEIANQGTTHPSLLNALGMPNNARDPRYRPAKPGSHEPVEVGTGGAEAGPAKGVHSDAVSRRLSTLGGVDLTASLIASAAQKNEVAGKVRELIPYLQELARVGAGAVPAKTIEDAEVLASKHVPVNWPAFFEPHMIVSHRQQDQVLALSRQGRGVFVETATATEGAAAAATPVLLAGASAHGSLLAAHWDSAGLLLVTKTGTTLECPGAPAGGRWRCAPLPGAALPFEGAASGGRVAVGRSAEGLRAAVVFEGEDSVAMYSRAHSADAAWLPAGEVHLRGSMPVAAAFAANAEALLLTSADGAVIQMHTAKGAVSKVASAVAGEHGRPWSACRLPAGGLARLAVAKAGFSEPKLLLD